MYNVFGTLAGDRDAPLHTCPQPDPGPMKVCVHEDPPHARVI